MEQAREASQRLNVFAGMRKIAALPPVSVPPGDFVNAPIAMYCRHHDGWKVVFPVPDPGIRGGSAMPALTRAPRLAHDRKSAIDGNGGAGDEVRRVG
jgi:hypothetical protein